MKSVNQVKRLVVPIKYQLNGVIALALWPIAVTKEIKQVTALGGHCAKQTLLSVPDIVTSFVEPENGASLESA